MRLLLDTHAFLWWLSDDHQLGARARDLVADPGNDVLVSAVSLWEIVVKRRVGKLGANIGETLDTLAMHHRDPFNYLLIAQAITEDATFLSEDRHTPHYPVRFVTCAR